MTEQKCLNFDQFYYIVNTDTPDDTLVGLKRHVENCEKCTDQLDFIQQMYNSMLESKKNEVDYQKNHILEEMKEEYFQQNLSQRDIDAVHSHLASCSDCFEEFASISATAFSKPSLEEKSILAQIEAVEIKDRVAPYERPFIMETPSISFVNKLGRLFKNQKSSFSVPRLATALAFVLVSSFFGYQQIKTLNLLSKSGQAFSEVLKENKIGPDAPRLIGSVAKLISAHRGEKSEQPKISAAELALLDALKRKTDDVKLNHQLGTVYFFSGNMEKAEEYYLKALNLDENDAKIYNDLALIETNRKNLEKALTRLNQALQLNPNLLEARYNKAIVFQLRKDTPHAIQAWEKYLELDLDLDSDWNKVARSHLMELREF